MKKYQKYILTSVSEYYSLNEALSKLRGWKIGLPTERVLSMTPRLAEVNIQVGDKINTSYWIVMVVTGEMQENYPELFEGFELLEKHDIVFTDIQLEDIIVEDMTTEQIDWLLNHQDVAGTYKDLIWAEIEPRSELSDTAVESLVARDVIVITAE